MIAVGTRKRDAIILLEDVCYHLNMQLQGEKQPRGKTSSLLKRVIKLHDKLIEAV